MSINIKGNSIYICFDVEVKDSWKALESIKIWILGGVILQYLKK